MAFDDHAIGVVVGLTAEARIARRLPWRVAVGGGTVSGAKAAATDLIGAGVHALVSFGLAGGLDPALRPGTVIVPPRVVCDHSCYAADPQLMCRLGGATPHVLFAPADLVSCAAAKGRLREATGAAALDLESGVVARAASARRMPFAVLRAICDPAECSLPAAALAALDARGAVAASRVLASLAARPGQLPALLRLAADAIAARRALIKRMTALARVPAPSTRSR